MNNLSEQCKNKNSKGLGGDIVIVHETEQFEHTILFCCILF